MKKILFIFATFVVCKAAEWNYLENELENRAWLGEIDDQVQQIYLDEEVEENIIVAYMSYKGDQEPTIQFITNDNSRLGLVFERNPDYNNYWGLTVTIKQDYEDPIWSALNRRYVFSVTADGYTFNTILNINNIDDNPPVLQAVSDTTCSIPENQVGFSNCTYTISDPDGWIQFTTYSIKGSHNESSLFQFVLLEDEKAIKNTTYEAILVLETVIELDFEIRSVYFFTVVATDSGGNTNQLRIYVEVEDRPDMPPTWTSIFASLQFDEKTSQTYSVNAIDGDVGLDWKINYWITTDSEWEEFFKIDNSTGIITINPINRDVLDNSIYYFTIFAYEVPDPSWKINQTVTVIVNDVNDNVPEITINPESVSIYENRSSTLEMNITISDIDTGSNAIYEVELIDDLSGLNYNEAFQIVPTQGYQTWSFSISVLNSSMLDYEVEDWQQITFMIYSRETQNVSHVDFKTVKVSLINWNDEYPIFESAEYEVSVNETIGINENIATVYAVDRDIGDSVTHSLLGTAINKVLSIDSITGEILTITDNSFDYETADEVIVQVRATDSMNDTTHTVIAQLTVYVLDINDEPPVISVPSTIISIEENQNNGSVITEEITATDPDTTAHLKFSINWTSATTYATKNGQRVSSEYYLESVIVETVNISKDSTGYARAVLMVNEIIVENTPDYELFDTLYLTLNVEDLNQVVNEGRASVIISISIIDLNDNAPIFSNSSITANNTVFENAPANTLIGTITATDADGVNYNVVKYYLKVADKETPEDWVTIDIDSGQLTVKTSELIDADIPIYYLNYTITATDGELETEANISIYIIDTNDNPPVIKSNLNEPFEIYEKSEDFTNVTMVIAEDADRDSPYNSIYYTLSTLDEEVYYLFEFSETTGLFYVNKRFNKELDRDFNVDSYTVTFTVADNYMKTDVSYSVTGTFIVKLLDINDQYPIIYNSSIITTENIKKGDCFGNLMAYDNDEEGSDNTKIDFNILSTTKGEDAVKTPPSDLFTLTTDEEFKSQKASVCTNYDLRGYYGTFKVSIRTNDFGTNPSQLFYDQILDFVVEKYNFEAPNFIYPVNNSVIYLSKTQSLNTQLYLYNGNGLNLFSAIDNQDGKWDLFLSIGSETNSENSETSFFSLQTQSNSSSRLVLTSHPDYDTEYKLMLKADCQCAGEEPFVSTVIVNIRFFDVTSEPSFVSSTQNLSFYENTTGVGTSKTILEAFWNSDGQEWNDFPIYYLIETDSTDGHFQLKPKSRELTLKSMLDREEKDSHVLTVQASQNLQGSASPTPSARLTIYIQVLDVNDNPPNFNESQYFGGVTTSTTVGTTVLKLDAHDLDIDVLTYSIDTSSITISDNSLSSLIQPFLLDGTTGAITLNFQVLANMIGYFTFTAVVKDLADHKDETSVKIYIASESNRVKFTFENTVSYVNSKYNFINSILEEILGYAVIIESITSGTDSDGNKIDGEADVITHFIDEKNNEVIEANVIQNAASNLVTFTNLRKTLLETSSLYLKSLTDDNSTTDNTDSVLKIWLIVFTLVLFVLSAGLTVAFIFKTRSLTQRLKKLTEKKFGFGSQESGLNRINHIAAPGTNKNAVEGSNPVYNEFKKMPDIDTFSFSSGDSDLIGIEESADFDPKPQQIKNGNINNKKERY